jgi:ATP-dependent exoDNAse (exonuclease V) alpha subunit
MWSKKYHVLAVAITALILAGIYYATRSEEQKLASAMQSAIDDHEHEDALMYASKLLALQPGNPDAKRVIKNSSEIFTHLQNARDALSAFWTLKDGAKVEPEKLYKGLQQSRKHVGTAKALDPKFETTLEFEEKLDEAQARLIYIFASFVKEIGDGTVSKAAEEYRKTSAIIDSAASSKYLSKFLGVQSAWATKSEPVQQAMTELQEQLNKMEEVSSLVSDYEGKSAKSLIKALQVYMQSVRETIDTVLNPHGTYNDYIQSVSKGTETFEKAQKRLVSSIPDSFVAKNDYSRLLEDISEYKIFRNESTAQIMAESQAL